MHPGARCVGERDQLLEGIEGANVEVARLRMTIVATSGSRRRASSRAPPPAIDRSRRSADRHPMPCRGLAGERRARSSRAAGRRLRMRSRGAPTSPQRPTSQPERARRAFWAAARQVTCPIWEPVTRAPLAVNGSPSSSLSHTPQISSNTASAGPVATDAEFWSQADVSQSAASPGPRARTEADVEVEPHRHRRQRVHTLCVPGMFSSSRPNSPPLHRHRNWEPRFRQAGPPLGAVGAPSTRAAMSCTGGSSRQSTAAP